LYISFSGPADRAGGGGGGGGAALPTGAAGAFLIPFIAGAKEVAAMGARAVLAVVAAGVVLRVIGGAGLDAPGNALAVGRDLAALA
jgi:hypothetical protein